MPVTHKNRLRTTISNTPGAAGALTISTASSGYRTFVAGDDALTFDVVITDGTAWEVRTDCTYTHSGTSLSRGTLEDSSTGSAITLTSAAVVTVTASAGFGNAVENMLQGLQPGGRLTLTSGVPLTTSDVTSASTIYYTPYKHNQIALWNGSSWEPRTFSETSLALSGLTSGKPYDVFGYLSSGVLVLELLVWTDDLTRATAVTLQDGRYCKSGDKTRLLLGTIYTTSATTTADSLQYRYVGNLYNAERATLQVGASGSHTYSSVTWRDWNGSTLEMAAVTPIAQRCEWGALRFQALGPDGPPRAGIDLNTTTAGGNLLASQSQPINQTLVTMSPINGFAVAAGRNYFRGVQRADTAISASFSSLNLYLTFSC